MWFIVHYNNNRNTNSTEKWVSLQRDWAIHFVFVTSLHITPNFIMHVKQKATVFCSSIYLIWYIQPPRIVLPPLPPLSFVETSFYLFYWYIFGVSSFVLVKIEILFTYSRFNVLRVLCISTYTNLPLKCLLCVAPAIARALALVQLLLLRLTHTIFLLRSKRAHIAIILPFFLSTNTLSKRTQVGMWRSVVFAGTKTIFSFFTRCHIAMTAQMCRLRSHFFSTPYIYINYSVECERRVVFFLLLMVVAVLCWYFWCMPRS